MLSEAKHLDLCWTYRHGLEVTSWILRFPDRGVCPLRLTPEAQGPD